MSVYRTAKGKAVDMASLTSTYEKTRAVGNMGVNARGDILDSHDKVVRDRTNRIQAAYTNSVTAENEKPSTPIREPLVADAPTLDLSELTPEELEFEQNDDEEPKS